MIRGTLLFFTLLGTAVMAQASTPFVSVDVDRRAKQAVPAAGKSLIYVYRLTDRGPAESGLVRMNGHPVRDLVANSYVYRSAGPGRLTIQAGDTEPLTIQVRAGRIYFFRVTAGRSGHDQLQQVSYGVGRRELYRAGLLREDPTAASRARAKPAPQAKKKPAPARGAARSTDSVPRSAARSSFDVILKGGAVALASTSQAINADAGGTPVTFQSSFDSSAGTFGLEGEWFDDSGWAFGGEVLVRKHGYTTVPAGSIGNGDMQIVTVAVNAKKYFRPESIVQPYVGGGLGIVSATMSGQLEGTSIGYVVQGMGGLAFRWEHVGLFTEIKYQLAETADVSASGFGYFAGFGIRF